MLEQGAHDQKGEGAEQDEEQEPTSTVLHGRTLARVKPHIHVSTFFGVLWSFLNPPLMS